jgi:N-methylhydantoinase A
VLGYIDAGTFLHGDFQLDLEAARQAISRDVAEPLGISIEEAAAGIYQLVNVNMATGVRYITVRRGLDPREFPIVVAGGAGPVHAAAIARELEIPVLITPRDSSIFCAAGMLVCDFKHDYVRGLKGRLHELDLEELVSIWTDLRDQGRATLLSEGVAEEDISFVSSIDARYLHQWYELNVELPDGSIDSPDLDVAAGFFHDLHERLFGYNSPETPVEVLNIRLTAIGRTPNDRIDLASSVDIDAVDEVRHRDAWSLTLQKMVSVPVHNGAALGPGITIEGPAIIELGTTTIVVHDEYDSVVDANGSFVLYLKKQRDELLQRLNIPATATLA